ncbi:hypothetical protein D3C84_759750 [compost metagenome]
MEVTPINWTVSEPTVTEKLSVWSAAETFTSASKTVRAVAESPAIAPSNFAANDFALSELSTVISAVSPLPTTASLPAEKRFADVVAVPKPAGIARLSTTLAVLVAPASLLVWNEPTALADAFFNVTSIVS